MLADKQLSIEYRVGRYVVFINRIPIGYWTPEQFENFARDAVRMQFGNLVIWTCPELHTTDTPDAQAKDTA